MTRREWIFLVKEAELSIVNKYKKKKIEEKVGMAVVKSTKTVVEN